MSNAVLISIRPEWCELIANGEKVVEVRKTRPKINTPFKCYIYETRGYERVGNDNLNCVIGGKGRGKVIGEFICNAIFPLDNVSTNRWDLLQGSIHRRQKFVVEELACLTEPQLHDYANGKFCYGWHISNLKIYDKPKELKHFQIPTTFPARRVRQAPQSWCYIEELP